MANKKKCAQHSIQTDGTRREVQHVLERSKIFWPNFPGEPVSHEIFEQCHHVILTPAQLTTSQQTLVAAKASIGSRDEWGNWTEQALINKGFKVLDQPTILASTEPDGRFAIQFVYLPKQPRQRAMENLADQLFDESGKLKTKTRGQTRVKERSDKAFKLRTETQALL